MAIYLIDYENTGVKGLYGIEQLKEDDLVIVFYGPKTGAVPFDEHVRISTASSHVEYIKTTKTAKNYLDFQLTTYLGYLVAQTAVRVFRIVSKDSGYDSVVDFWNKRGMNIRRQENVAGEKKATQSNVKKKKTTQNAKKEEKKELADSNAMIEKNEAVEMQAEVAQTPAPLEETKTEKKKVTKKETKKDTKNDTKKEVQVPKTVPEATRKKIREALKEENPHAGVYRAIYACMLQSTDKQSFNTALVRQFTQEMGNKYYKAVLPAFSEWIKHV